MPSKTASGSQVLRDLKPGNRVMIFQDPITCTREEGIATLVKLYFEDPAPFHNEGDRLEQWSVRFDGERETYERTIKTRICDDGR